MARIVNEALLERFRRSANCQWCGKRTPEGCDPHHLFTRGMGGATRLDVRVNLIALCRRCHDLVHLGRLLRCDLLAVVAAREGMPQRDVEAAIYQLRRATR